MNLLIKLKPNTNLKWFIEKLDVNPMLRDQGIISEIAKDGSHISVLVSIADEESTAFTREVLLISPQVVSVSRA